MLSLSEISSSMLSVVSKSTVEIFRSSGSESSALSELDSLSSFRSTVMVCALHLILVSLMSRDILNIW